MDERILQRTKTLVVLIKHEVRESNEERHINEQLDITLIINTV